MESQEEDTLPPSLASGSRNNFSTPPPPTTAADPALANAAILEQTQASVLMVRQSEDQQPVNGRSTARHSNDDYSSLHGTTQYQEDEDLRQILSSDVCIIIMLLL